MLPHSNSDRAGSLRRASPASASCSPHPFLPSSPYLVFIIPFLRDYILLMWDGATWTFHIPPEFLRTSQVTTAFLITSKAQPSCLSCTLKVYSSFPSALPSCNWPSSCPQRKPTLLLWCDVMDNHGGTCLSAEENIPPCLTSTRWNWESMQSFIHHKQ